MQKPEEGGDHRWPVWLEWICSHGDLQRSSLDIHAEAPVQADSAILDNNNNICLLLCHLILSLGPITTSLEVNRCLGPESRFISAHCGPCSFNLPGWFRLSRKGRICFHATPRNGESCWAAAQGRGGDTSPAVRAEDLQDAHACSLQSTRSASPQSPL